MVCNLASYFTERHGEATKGVSASSAMTPWEMRYPQLHASPSCLSLGLGEMSHLGASPSGSSESSTFTGWRLFFIRDFMVVAEGKEGKAGTPHPSQGDVTA